MNAFVLDTMSSVGEVKAKNLRIVSNGRQILQNLVPYPIARYKTVPGINSILDEFLLDSLTSLQRQILEQLGA